MYLDIINNKGTEIFRKSSEEKKLIKEFKKTCTNKSPKGGNMYQVHSKFITNQRIGNKIIKHYVVDGKLTKKKVYDTI